jgi:CubicO group peptidase (beta-lactamase class C family)
MVKLYLVSFIQVFFLVEASAMANLQQQVDSFKARSELPAFGAAVIKNRTIEIAVSGVRKFDEPTPVTNSDKWHIGSMTKSMTAVVVATLIKNNHLSWTSTLSEIFPDFKFSDEYKSLPITRLLTHTAGIDDESIFNDKKLADEVFAPGNSVKQTRFLLAKRVSEMPMTKPLGQHHYSNVGYMIVGAIIEKITGKAWEEAVTENLFTPMGMTSCAFGPTTIDAGSPAVQPWGHSRDEDGKIYAITPGPNADNPPDLGPAGTVHCSLEDIAKYTRFHLDQLAKRPTPLGLTSYDPLYEDLYDVGYTAGGLVIKKDSSWAKGRLLWHNGSNTFNYSIMMLAPNLDEAVVGTTNFGVVQEAGETINELMKLIRSN